MNAEETGGRGRDARGCRVAHPIAGPRVKSIHVEHRNRVRSERCQEPELSVQGLERVAPELAADGQVELAGEGGVEGAPALARELEIRRQELCQVHFDGEDARAPRFLEERADAAPSRVLCQHHRQTGAREVALEVLERGRGLSGRDKCNELRKGRGATRYMNSSMVAGESPRSFRVYRPGPACTSVGLPAGRPRKLPAKRVENLREVRPGHGPVRHAVVSWPATPGQELRPEHTVEHRKVDREVLVDRLGFGRVVEMVVAGRHQTGVEPLETGAEVRVDEDRMEGDEGQ